MLTDKEKEQFMPREEAKLRKWASRQRALKELIDASDAYYRTEKDVEKSTYYLRVKNLLCLLKERADSHAEKWQMKMKENGKKDTPQRGPCVVNKYDRTLLR